MRCGALLILIAVVLDLVSAASPISLVEAAPTEEKIRILATESSWEACQELPILNETCVEIYVIPTNLVRTGWLYE